jgi:uncharacterized membrane protein YphA (DoxX/SURF4 family)
MDLAAPSTRRLRALLRLHAPLALNAAALALRVYAASVWARFAADKITHGWLESNQLGTILGLVADGHMPARVPHYDTLMQWTLRLGLDGPGSRLLPVLEMAIAVALLTGVRLRLVALVATVVNLNLLLSGIGSVALDGRLVVIQLLLAAAAERAAHPSMADATGLVRRWRSGQPLHCHG